MYPTNKSNTVAQEITPIISHHTDIQMDELTRLVNDWIQQFSEINNAYQKIWFELTSQNSFSNKDKTVKDKFYEDISTLSKAFETEYPQPVSTFAIARDTIAHQTFAQYCNAIEETVLVKLKYSDFNHKKIREVSKIHDYEHLKIDLCKKIIRNACQEIIMNISHPGKIALVQFENDDFFSLNFWDAFGHFVSLPIKNNEVIQSYFDELPLNQHLNFSLLDLDETDLTQTDIEERTRKRDALLTEVQSIGNKHVNENSFNVIFDNHKISYCNGLTFERYLNSYQENSIWYLNRRLDQDNLTDDVLQKYQNTSMWLSRSKKKSEISDLQLNISALPLTLFKMYQEIAKKYDCAPIENLIQSLQMVLQKVHEIKNDHTLNADVKYQLIKRSEGDIEFVLKKLNQTNNRLKSFIVDLETKNNKLINQVFEFAPDELLEDNDQRIWNAYQRLQSQDLCYEMQDILDKQYRAFLKPDFLYLNIEHKRLKKYDELFDKVPSIQYEPTKIRGISVLVTPLLLWSCCLLAILAMMMIQFMSGSDSKLQAISQALLFISLLAISLGICAAIFFMKLRAYRNHSILNALANENRGSDDNIIEILELNTRALRSSASINNDEMIHPHEPEEKAALLSDSALFGRKNYLAMGKHNEVVIPCPVDMDEVNESSAVPMSR